MVQKGNDAPLSVEEKRARLAGGRGSPSSADRIGGGSVGDNAAGAGRSPRDVPAEPAASRKALAFRAGLSVAVCLLAMVLVIVVAMVVRG